MQTRKLFYCQACDADMEIADPQEQQQYACRECGRNHRMTYRIASQAWLFEADETVEDTPGQPPTEESFSALGEVGRPKRVDRSEKYREQTDVQPSSEAVDKRSERKP